MSNKGLLTIIIVILLGIFAVVAMNYHSDSPAENFAEGVSEITEDIDG